MSTNLLRKRLVITESPFTRMRMPNALAQNGIWWEFTSGTIPITDTTGDFLGVAAEKLTLKMQRML